jgi:hypothetical protein
MSLATNVTNLATRVATEFKTIRSLITGSGTGNLSTLTTTDKTSIIAAINEVKAGSSGAPADASETVRGIAEIATQAETTTGTDDTRIVTPLKLTQRLTAWAQPLSTNLTTLAGVASGVFGRTLLASASQSDARTALGLAAVATSGSASDITTGTLPTSVFPPLAINDTFTVNSQAAMLALTAQRGDVAIRTDINRSFILSADAPAVLGNWQQLTAGGDVNSVAGKTGAVVLVKADVGLANVDNTSDLSKPLSTAATAAMGDHTTNFVTVFETGLL